jgi:pilus assembly protein CpaB
MQKPRVRINPRAIALAAAVALAAIAYAASQQYLADRERAAEERVAERHRRVPVIVVRTDLSAGTVVQPEMLALRQIPERYVVASAARPDDVERIVGQRLLHDLRSGEPLQWPALAGAAATFSAGLESGRRALTFPVDEVNALSGMLAPGDVIDLLYTDTRSAPRVTVRPLLQRVAVLATGTTTRPDLDPIDGADARGGTRDSPAQFATITLSVTPEEAQLIVLAQRAGELTAVLRHPADAAAAPARAITVAALAGAAAPRATPAVDAAEYVEFVTGGRRGLAGSTRVRVEGAPVASGRSPPALETDERAAASGPVANTGADSRPAPRPDAGDVRARLGLTRPRA